MTKICACACACVCVTNSTSIANAWFTHEAARREAHSIANEYLFGGKIYDVSTTRRQPQQCRRHQRPCQINELEKKKEKNETNEKRQGDKRNEVTRKAKRTKIMRTPNAITCFRNVQKTIKIYDERGECIIKDGNDDEVSTKEKKNHREKCIFRCNNSFRVFTMFRSERNRSTKHFEWHTN